MSETLQSYFGWQIGSPGSKHLYLQFSREKCLFSPGNVHFSIDVGQCTVLSKYREH